MAQKSESMSRKAFIAANDEDKARIILYAYQQGVGNGWFNVINKIISDNPILTDDIESILDEYFGERSLFYRNLSGAKESSDHKDYVDKILGPRRKTLKKAPAVADKPPRNIEEMNKKDLEKIVMEVLTENSGKGYTPYPYGSSVREEEAPKDDYTEEWKSFSTDLTRDTSRETAITVAKILVQDLELFEDVLDLAGQNQSVGEEILRKLKEAREKQQNV
jgi:hypothetical protein